MAERPVKKTPPRRNCEPAHPIAAGHRIPSALQDCGPHHRGVEAKPADPSRTSASRRESTSAQLIQEQGFWAARSVARCCSDDTRRGMVAVLRFMRSFICECGRTSVRPSPTFLGVLWMSAIVGVLTSCDCPTSNIDSGLDDGGSDGGDAGGNGGADAGCQGGCRLRSEQQVFVDGISGVDACCCGPSASPCQSITYAMGEVQDAGVVSVEILASNSDGSSEWVAPESWPISLSNGVTLTAPKISFNPPASLPTAFLLEPREPGDADLEVTIQGDPYVPGRDVRIGVPPPDAGVSNATTAIRANAGRRLRISNAWIHDHGYGLELASGTTLTIGPLPVAIGSNDGLLDPAIAGYGGEGIRTLGASQITDEGNSTLRIDAHAVDISLEPGAEVSLIHGPRLGVSPGPGFSCPDWSSEIGLLTNGLAAIELGSVDDPATISCCNTAGMQIQPDVAGNGAEVAFAGSLLNNACWGAAIHAGHLQIGTGSTVRYNRTGIWIDRDAGLDLERFGTPVDLSCNGKFEVPEDCYWDFTHGPTDAALAVTSTGEVAATNALWSHWGGDAGTPVQTWTCNDFEDTPCSCSGPNCPFDAGWPWPIPTDLTLLHGDTDPGGVTFAGGALSTQGCDTAN